MSRSSSNLPYEKVGKNEPVCIADEVPFEIPESWEWVRLKNIATVLGGKRIPAGRKLTTTNTGHTYIRVSDMKNGSVLTDGLLYVPEDIFPSISRYIIKKEDLYITVAGTIGSVGIVPPELDGANLTENADRLVFSHIDQNWFMQCLSSSLVQNQIAEATTKVGQPKLAIKRIEELLIALPPYDEQKRIVDKIKELNPFIANYEAKEKDITALNDEFPVLLRKSILQQAVMGKLVPQDDNDEPASVLLDRIRAEKESLIKAGKLKKDKHESIIYRRDNSHYEKLDGVERCIDDEIPFEIPVSWEWCRVKDIVIKEIKRGKSPQYANSGRNYVFAQKCNVKTGGIDMTLAKFLSDVTFEKYPCDEYMLDEDIVINSTGNGTLGRIGIFHDTDRIGLGEVVPDSHVTVIRKSPHISTMYVFYVLRYYQPYLEKQGEGSTNQTELKPTIISDLFFPLPPYREQQQIAERIAQSFTSMTALS